MNQALPLLPAFTLRQLAYFVTAADAGTIAAAATTLRVSPSAMSDAITELETALGERLCVRRRAQGLTLTSSGIQLLPLARRVLAEADELASLALGRGALSGPITVGCYPTLAPTVLPPLLQDFGARHPGVELAIHEATQDQLADGLTSGRLDVAVVYDMLVPGNTRRARLYELRAHALLSANHPLAAAPEVELAELVEDDLILLDAPPSSEHTLSLFAAQGLSPRVRHRTTNYEVVRSLVARGLGYGILVSQVSHQRSTEGRPLVVKAITPPVAPVAVDMIWAPDRPLPARTQALIEFAQEVEWTRATPDRQQTG
ncbi:LysR substrate-binding domain-containing protein [Leucobacter chromiireducens]|uniref:LysR substrate-binding domain-containing protein n=1 Tax=Leucobacter chromiireducens TaxID=283877 RepID=UPI003F7D50BF